jgi:hypothetical protein
MILLFTLSMPGVNSWNGRWSGEDRQFSVSKNFGRTQKAEAKAKAILSIGHYSYSFGDGWVAGVSVKSVTPQESRAAKKKSAGFCGYDWMVESILTNGKIQA